MYVNPFQISMDTLIAAAPMLGHKLESRNSIRDAQDPSLVAAIQAASTAPLRNREQADLFCVAPLDILVTEARGLKQFHIIEVNGTGIGGLTNLSEQAIRAVLDGFAHMAEQLPGEPLVLVAVSGKESDKTPRLNKLLHEKVLYLEALRRGFEESGRDAVVLTMAQLQQDPDAVRVGKPVIVLGYIKEFLDNVQLDRGRAMLFGRQVDAAINDRFCLNLVNQLDHRVNLNTLATMNRCFVAGADKGVAYDLLNEFLCIHPRPCCPSRVHFAHARNRGELIDTVVAWVRAGRQTVIKPQGTGLGHGIEFFLTPDESVADISARIDGSIRLTQQFYRARDGAFPYTVCEYLDTCTVRQPGHDLHGHKYELRVVVYRDRNMLKAFPSIVKVSPQAFDSDAPTRSSLINNITASSEATKTAGVEHMLPLSNWSTLRLLGLRLSHLRQVSALATQFVRFLLDKVQDEPERMGLPATPVLTAVESVPFGFESLRVG